VPKTALVYFDGKLSHAVRKPAILHGPDQGEDRRFESLGGVRVTETRPIGEQLVVAKKVLHVMSIRGHHPSMRGSI
jgi:hypothetical protein